MSVKDKEKFYKTDTWQSLRNRALIRDKYMCQCCKANNKMVNADCVHHIFPIERYPEYADKMWNLMSLCSKCHNEMHNHYTGELSKQGMLFLRSIAAVMNIPVSCKESTTLVIGIRGTGKTTYCKQHMDDNTLVYDLDAIAGAFRLKQPHEEYFKPARRMANDFLKGFLAKAKEYCKKIIIIRTAPTIKEIEDIKPDKLVVCTTVYSSRDMDEKKEALERIDAATKYCMRQHMDVEILK